MAHEYPSEEDSNGMCIACGRWIDWKCGMSLAGNVYHCDICKECWGRMSIAERLTVAAKWRLLEKQGECLDAFRDLIQNGVDDQNQRKRPFWFGTHGEG
jgi:hypothetical protein